MTMDNSKEEKPAETIVSSDHKNETWVADKEILEDGTEKVTMRRKTVHSKPKQSKKSSS